MFSFIKSLLYPFLFVNVWCAPIRVEPLPIVVLHGIDSSSQDLAPFSAWLANTFSETVINIEIANGKRSSVYMPMSPQVEELCETIYSYEELKNGFNFIGMSQGGLLARGYVERCNDFPVVNLITLVSPHGGIYFPNNKINMYDTLIQEHFSVAGYWRDPTNIVLYLNKCSYLPFINNALPHTEYENQKANIMTLANLVLVWSPNDMILSPPESAIFSVYAEDLAVMSLFDTDLYNEDRLGLKYLNEQNKLHMYETNCSHVDHRNPACYAQLEPILAKYL